MTDTYTSRTEFYVELPETWLKEPISEATTLAYIYDTSIQLNEQAARCLRYLKNGNIAINIFMSAAIYVKESDTVSWINEVQFEEAKTQYGVTEFLTEEEFLALELRDQIQT